MRRAWGILTNWPKPVDRGQDFYGVESLLTEDERALKNRVRAFMDREVIPVEANYTYEGANEINTRVVGREITGLQAFV